MVSVMVMLFFGGGPGEEFLKEVENFPGGV